MKILVITDLYPVSETEKFTPRTIKNFVTEWEKMGHEVKIIKPNFLLNSFLRGKPFYKTGTYGQVENVNYFLPFLGNIKNKVRTLTLTSTLSWIIRGACGVASDTHLTGSTSLHPTENPLSPGEGDMFDAVFAHMPSGIIFANRLGVDFTAGVHVSDLEVLTNPIYSIYFKSELEKAYKNAKKIACRSVVLKQKFLKLYPEFESKTFVAFSGIDTQIVHRNWNPNGRVKVLTCANLIKRKNVDKVIRECENLDVDLTIIGDGKELSRLKKLSTKPKFLGWIEHDKVLEEMRRADIFALPSINETFGMVYLEAMASGCITVCTENDGAAGIIQNGENGYFWKDGIIKEIIDAQDKQRILNNSYKTILNYTSKNAAINYLNHLN